MKKQAPSFRNLYFPCSDWPGSWAPLSVAPGASQASWIPPWGPPLAHPKSSKIFVSIVGATIFLEFSKSVGQDTGLIFGYKKNFQVQRPSSFLRFFDSTYFAKRLRLLAFLPPAVPLRGLILYDFPLSGPSFSARSAKSQKIQAFSLILKQNPSFSNVFH